MSDDSQSVPPEVPHEGASHTSGPDGEEALRLERIAQERAEAEEEAERRVQEASARARIEAENRERQRLEQEARQREQEAADRAIREANEKIAAEQEAQRRIRDAAEKARLDAEAQEKERQRQEQERLAMEAAERTRAQAEEARLAEIVMAQRIQEAAEQARQLAEHQERLRMDAEIAAKAASQSTQLVEDASQRARAEAEAAERLMREAEEAQLAVRAARAAARAATDPTAPPPPAPAPPVVVQAVPQAPSSTTHHVDPNSFTLRPDDMVVPSVSQVLFTPQSDASEIVRKAQEVHDAPTQSKPPGSAFSYTFKVTDPKVSQSSILDFSFVSYQVITTTTNPKWKGPEAKVSRRYNDFFWFRTQLGLDYPGTIVPPIPPKDIQGTVEKVVMSSTALIEFRQRALTKFVSGVGSHELLAESEHLQKFCEATSDEWERFKTEKQRASAQDQPGVMEKAKKAFAGAIKSQPPTDVGLDPKWPKLRNYMRGQRDALTVLKTYMDGLVQTRRDTYRTFLEIGGCLGRLSSVETIVDAADTAPTSRDSGNLNTYCKEVANLYGDQAMKEMCLVAESIFYYGGMYASALEALDTLTNVNGQLQSADGDMKKAQAEYNALPNKSDVKAITLDSKVKFCTTKVDTLREKVKAVETRLDVDLNKLLANRNTDWKYLMSLFVELQISLSRRIVAVEVQQVADRI
eukprot:PhF_6_TR41352/c0_g1_i2/m.62778